jgi:6-methylsalicylate decarboxylase
LAGLPIAPVEVGKLFAGGLENYPDIDADTRAAIDRGNAPALFPRFR